MLTSAGLPVSAQALMFDFPVFLAVAIVCIPIFYTRWEISRWEGVLFLCYYGAYVTYLVLSGMGSSWTPAFTTVTGWLVVASMLVVIVDLVRSLRQRPAVKRGGQR
jgi:cation:H+ antiporter